MNGLMQAFNVLFAILNHSFVVFGVRLNLTIIMIENSKKHIESLH